MRTTAERRWRRARQYLDAQQWASARAVLDSILALDPADIDAHLALAGLAWSEGRVREACRNALAAIRVADNAPEAILAVADALLQVGETAAAHAMLERPALTEARLETPQLLQLAGAHQALGQHAAALGVLDRVRARTPDMGGMQFRFTYAMELAFNGRLDAAAKELEMCIAADTTYGRVFVEAARMHRATPAHNHLHVLGRRLAAAQSGSEDAAALEFARYKELEDLGRSGEAWTALARGNALMAARGGYDAGHAAALFQRQLRVCSAQFLRSITGHADGDSQPIFIIGMTRSGTTLLEGLLGAHPDVHAAGELHDFGQQLRWAGDNPSRLQPDEAMLARLPGLDFAELGRRYLAQTAWRPEGRRFFTDKRPGNWIVAGLIAKALPRAPIINLVRDPMDVCFSNFRAYFGAAYPWSYDLAWLASRYRLYAEAMVHWREALPDRILDVSYAKLVRDPEAAVRRVLAYCGLDWSPACLNIEHRSAPVATFSFDQVRAPIHQRSFNAWEPYTAHLEPLRAGLAGCATS